MHLLLYVMQRMRLLEMVLFGILVNMLKDIPVFFYLITIVILAKFGIDLVIASKLIGVVAFFILALSLFVYITKKEVQNKSKIIALLPVSFTVLSFPLILTSLGGLEGSIFLFFVL